jgi:tripartite-type tricarboxylate transporter receptor subunit TctC
LLLSSGVLAQPVYPSKPLHLVVPFPAGGPTDIITRALGQKLSEALGQPVLVDNKLGAGGAIGSAIVAKSAPDGYTILMGTTSTHSIGPLLNSKTPYNVERDFVPVCMVARATQILVVAPSLPVNNVAELIALAKARPGQLNYSSSGVGTIVHLTSEMFRSMAGVDIVHVPYKGVSLAIPDLMSGRISMMFDSIVTALPQVKSGKVKALAIASATRSALVPELPTVAEAGLPGFDGDTYFGVFAPAGTPRDIVARLNAELTKIVHLQEIKERLSAQGAEPVGTTPEQFARVIKAANAKWARVIKDAGVSVE